MPPIAHPGRFLKRELQSQYELAVVERERGEEIARKVHPRSVA